MFDGSLRQNQSPWVDLLWLLALALLLIATGIGLRDPWPPDEPRFALVARDMVATGDWLLPRVGGQPYADKPPLFFWLIALGLQLTHSLRVAFLLPSFLAGFGCVALVYDLGRRLWNREAGLAGALALLFTVQFVWQARQAQIDATLCFWTTLSLYGLLRHLLLGPSWRWYTIGWAAAGLGVITKGVGFLPLLVLIPFAILRDPRWQPRKAAGRRRALAPRTARVPRCRRASGSCRCCSPRTAIRRWLRIATTFCSTRPSSATATPGIIASRSGTSSST